ncbi:MAG: coproporphyrinogen III oxidase [Planctomyces sp.]|nr:coproporphyrinogen III oxidase [Planctomyces sp.]
MLAEPARGTSIVPPSGMALYIHVPFCKTKCPYCDFNTYQGIERLMDPYMGALTQEITQWGELLEGPVVNSVFFGGGTPSYLNEGYIGRILESAGSSFQLGADAEITIEANPGDLDLEACQRLVKAGVNRLSIGVQSLDNGLLSILGRRHDADQAMEALQIARNGGLSDINLDFMYGLPNQTMPQWQDTMQRMVSQRPTHISLYCLTLEEGTPLHHWVETGKLPQSDQDLAADMYHYAADLMEQEGYQHYEISNWCLPGFECRHNLCYWLNQPYLGVGPGAHSCLGTFRFWDISSPGTYIKAANDWSANNSPPVVELTEEVLESVFPVDHQEYIDPETFCAETMFLGLRLLEGMDLAEVSEQVGIDLAQRYASEISDLTELGLLEQVGPRLRLTKPAHLIANQVFTRFVG